MEGLTGKIKFDSSGFRSDFQLDIIELTKDGLEKVGFWSLDSGANFTRNFTQMYTDLIQSLHNTTLVVTTILVRTTRMKLFLFYCRLVGRCSRIMLCLFVVDRTLHHV